MNEESQWENKHRQPTTNSSTNLWLTNKCKQHTCDFPVAVVAYHGHQNNSAPANLTWTRTQRKQRQQSS
uniref:Uncharacterized protein n=1 Tax=Globodera rostochiensis TaxID=31243 RepID=A0A914I005_GLORO